MTPASNHCDNCGCRHYIREHGDRILEEKFELGERFKTMRAQHARTIAEWEIREIQHISEKKWLRRKVQNQSKVINRLEEKLRKLGEMPYKEEE